MDLIDRQIRNMVLYTRNVELLHIWNFRPFVNFALWNPQTKDAVMQLSQLKKLKEFHFWNSNKTFENFVGALMIAFTRKHVEIEDLRLWHFSINSNDIRSIICMKTLKQVVLNEIKSVLDEDLVCLTTELPLLTHLKLEFHQVFRPTSASVLIKMVQAGKRLVSIGLHGIGMFNIDQKVFESLLEAVSNRLTMEKLVIFIWGCKTTGIVSSDIQNIDRPQLKFEYISYICSCESCKLPHAIES